MNMLQCPSSLIQMNFKTQSFFKPSSYYKYKGDNLQHSVVNNNETQWRNSRVVALSTHARLQFNSSMSSLLGAFDFTRTHCVHIIHGAQRSYLWPWLLIVVNFTADTEHRLCFYTVKSSKSSFDQLINLVIYRKIPKISPSMYKPLQI